MNLKALFFRETLDECGDNLPEYMLDTRTFEHKGISVSVSPIFEIRAGDNVIGTVEHLSDYKFIITPSNSRNTIFEKATLSEAVDLLISKAGTFPVGVIK